MQCDMQSSSLADKIATISEARVLFGLAAARKMWSDFGMPDVDVSARVDEGGAGLRERILKLTSVPGGMTMGLIFNRCRTLGRETIEQEVLSLVEAGALKVERSISGNGKTVERFIAA